MTTEQPAPLPDSTTEQQMTCQSNTTLILPLEKQASSRDMGMLPRSGDKGAPSIDGEGITPFLKECRDFFEGTDLSDKWKHSIALQGQYWIS
jgi:hypothetical protein